MVCPGGLIGSVEAGVARGGADTDDNRGASGMGLRNGKREAGFGVATKVCAVLLVLTASLAGGEARASRGQEPVGKPAVPAAKTPSSPTRDTLMELVSRWNVPVPAAAKEEVKVKEETKAKEDVKAKGKARAKGDARAKEEPRAREELQTGHAPVSRDTGLGARTVRRALSVHGDVGKALNASDLPAGVVRELTAAMSFGPGFSNRVPKGAVLTVVYEHTADSRADSEPVLRVASFRSGDEERHLYRYATGASGVAYLDETGQGMEIVSLETPVDNVEISSGWGWRVHPVLGGKRFHQGVDFRAPRGTPARSAADGVVEEIGRRGNYGLYVRVRHASKLATAYAHLDRFAPDLKKGSVVRKGQPLGYIGTSGLATGPHLYYEVLVDSRQVNPLNIEKLPIPVRLTDSDLARFKSYIQSAKKTMLD